MTDLPIIDVPTELKIIYKRGFILSLRKDNTGVGYTLEHLLGIKENNQGEPDLIYNGLPVELKGQRASSQSRITLATKTPIWEPLKPKDIISKFGYKNKDGLQGLMCTLKITKFNKREFKLELDLKRNRLNLVHKTFGVVAYFNYKELMDAFEKKLYENLLLVLADTKTEGEKEAFRYKKAILFKKLIYAKFQEMLNEGHIIWEFRMYLKGNGSVRDHGPGFRIARKYLNDLYTENEVIFETQ